MTSIRRRILVDECLAKSIVSTYLKPHTEITKCGVDAVYFVDKYGNKGRWKDEDFVPHIARDVRWAVLSRDAGKQSPRLQALPYLCRIHGVTLIRITDALFLKGVATYGPQVIAHWERLLGAIEGPRGAEYVIRYQSSQTDATVFDLRRCPNGYIPHRGMCIPEP